MPKPTNKKIISVVVPVHNEEENISTLYAELQKVFKKLVRYDFELIYVDDGSTDHSWRNILRLAEKDKRIKPLQFARNFGKELATTAGIHHASGLAVKILDADLQHPPALIPLFLEKWEKGAEIVVGIRTSNQKEGLIKKIGSYFFYKLFSLISDTPIIHRGTDFRLMDRKVVDEFNRFSEKNRITRGLIDWLGFKRAFVHFDAPPRLKGTPSYSPVKLLKLALSSFISHSIFTLRLAGYLGIIIIALSGPFGLFIFIEKYLLHDPWNLRFSGPAILAVIILFLVGIILICLGLIALYIANIHTEVTNRPMYVIRNGKSNFYKDET
jgi:polyisoprenyl-phosphate glycosyltransferase